MDEQRIVNDDGLRALKLLASERAHLFIEADTEALKKRMAERVETDNLWGAPLNIRADLSQLNALTNGGPSTDAAFVPLVRQAFGHLPPAEGLNDYRWATVNCFVIPQYAQARWSNVQPKDMGKLPAHVKRHWLDGHLTDARQDNSIARLWWLGELSERAAEYSQRYDADNILNAMANNVNLYHQFLSRRNLVSRAKLVAAVYEVFLEDGNEYLRATRYANEMLSALNYLAADVSLDFMNMSELRDIVEEAKPPKEP